MFLALFYSALIWCGYNKCNVDDDLNDHLLKALTTGGGSELARFADSPFYCRGKIIPNQGNDVRKELTELFLPLQFETFQENVQGLGVHENIKEFIIPEIIRKNDWFVKDVKFRPFIVKGKAGQSLLVVITKLKNTGDQSVVGVFFLK